jgi:hypothetical protein
LSFIRNCYRIVFGPAQAMQELIFTKISDPTERQSAMKAYFLWMNLMLCDQKHQVFAPDLDESTAELLAETILTSV